MLTYNYDANCTLIQPIPNREAATITKAQLKNHERLTEVAAAPKHNVLDNEFSAEFLKALDNNDVTYEKVPLT